MWPRQETPLVHGSNPGEMDDTANIRHRRSRSATLLCCCCFGSDDFPSERSLLKPSWFHKVRRSNSGPEAIAVGADSPHWWRKGWNSVRRAGEWSESVVEDYAGGCCAGAKWKHFVRKCKADGKTICNSRPARFHYDQMSYQLNFDEGSRDFKEGDLLHRGFSATTDLPSSSKPKQQPLFELQPGSLPLLRFLPLEIGIELSLHSSSHFAQGRGTAVSSSEFALLAQ
ncbi:hypothetical protein KI387_028866, partial [Taxus chinensis]